MDFYNIFKKVIGLKSPRIKLIMLAAARICGMRYYGIFIDPVIACNIKCKMCYFSDPANKPPYQKPMTEEQINLLKKSVMKRALKMQIGCGAEPTICRNLTSLIKAGKTAGVPYIEITTNGQLLTHEQIKEYINAGLNGITLSLHATTKETYEYLMEGAKFDRLLNLINILRDIKSNTPSFKLRINYTVNNLNKKELLGLWQLFKDVKIDVLQVRPIQKLGETAYNDFTINDYDDLITNIIKPIEEEGKRHKTICLLPSRQNVEHVNRKTSIATSIIEDVSYCYIAPQSCYRDDFNPQTETIKQYQSRSGIAKRLHRAIFRQNLLTEKEDINATKKLNYS